MPSAFDSTGNMYGSQMGVGGAQMHGQPGGGGQQGQGGGLGDPGAQAGLNGTPLPSLAELDLSIQCKDSFMRSTVSRLVSSQAVATATRVPLGIVISPMAGDQVKKVLLFIFYFSKK